MTDKWFNLLAVVCAGCIVGGFMYAGRWDAAEQLAMLVIGGLLGLAGVKNGKT